MATASGQGGLSLTINPGIDPSFRESSDRGTQADNQCPNKRCDEHQRPHDLAVWSKEADDDQRAAKQGDRDDDRRPSDRAANLPEFVEVFLRGR